MDEKGHTGSMPNEQTPLIQSVPVAEHHNRYPHISIRRFCTITLAAIPLLTIAVVFICIAIVGDADFLGGHETEIAIANAIPHALWPQSDGIGYKKLKQILLDTPNGEKAREWSKYYTEGQHLAGKNLSQAEWTRDRWAEWGVDHAEVVAYDTYLNYPVDHRLVLLENGKVKYQASLEEPVLEEDPTSGSPDRVPTFHGYSANGDVTAPYVFCNYGTHWDYEDLLEAGVELRGKIALVKYGSNFRGLKVKRASELGMVGVVMYSDPGDDGEMTEENGYKAYPEGPARHPRSVQRGSTQYLTIAPGDPTTVGYPSKPGVPRQPATGKVPDIPSLPISYADALPLLQALNGHGPNASSFSKHWHTGGLGYKGVEYNIGPTPDSVQLNLMNQQEYVTTPVWNAIGVINGTVADEVIVVGNHRDAWIVCGAGDPNSGSASLNEVVRAFGAALKAGWKPHRTIVFASWDGEEYALLGSVEWVEEYLPWLSSAAVAYVNVDVATSGTEFGALAAPVLQKVLYEATAEVPSPNQTVEGQTVRDVWDGHIGTMGSGSDFTAFQDFAGISCVHIGYTSGPKDPVYHYHSNYDSFAWMEELGDPAFKYHVAIAQIVNLLVAKLVEEPIIKFNATDYAVGLRQYVDQVNDLVPDAQLAEAATSKPVKRLYAAVKKFKKASASFESKVEKLAADLASSDLTLEQKAAHHTAVRKINTQYKNLERKFIYPNGLDGRGWYKHVVFAPGIWTGYAGATFPGLVEALALKDEAAIARWSMIIEERIGNATALLLE